MEKISVSKPPIGTQIDLEAVGWATGSIRVFNPFSFCTQTYQKKTIVYTNYDDEDSSPPTLDSAYSVNMTVEEDI